MTDAKKEIKVEDLSPRAQSAVKVKRLMGRGRFKMFQQTLRELAQFDEITDALYKKAVNRSILFGILTAVVVIGDIIVFFNRADIARVVGPGSSGKTLAIIAVAVPAILAVVLLVFFIVQISKVISLGGIDLSNDFRLCLSPFLDELTEDVGANSKMKIDLDLKGLTDEKLISKQKIPPGRFKKVTEYIYKDHWLSMSLDLADGNVIILDVENDFVKHDRRWTKRSASGKTKFKHKDKWKKLVTVTASVVPKAAGIDWDPEKVNAAAREQKLRIAEKKGYKVLRLARKYKFKATDEEPKEAPPPNEIVGLFMQIYGMLAPAEQRSG